MKIIAFGFACVAFLWIVVQTDLIISERIRAPRISVTVRKSRRSHNGVNTPFPRPGVKLCQYSIVGIFEYACRWMTTPIVLARTNYPLRGEANTFTVKRVQHSSSKPLQLHTTQSGCNGGEFAYKTYLGDVSLARYIAGSFLKSARQDLQQSLISCPL